METRNKPCQKCTTAACVVGLRFCKECAVKVKREMIASGYLSGDGGTPVSEPTVEEYDDWLEAWGSYVGTDAPPEDAPDADEVAPDVEGDDVLYGFQEVERP